MIIFPAIDLYNKKAVRLFKGDYREMTVYSDSPVQVALDFKRCGATHIHTVDLEGAKDGTTPNLSVIADTIVIKIPSIRSFGLICRLTIDTERSKSSRPLAER